MQLFESKFISIGCNKVTSGTDWNIYGQVAFAAGKFIALFKPFDNTNNGITETLPGHKDVVNGVQFLKYGQRQGKILISYSADKTIRIWKINDNGKWIASCVLKGHTESIEAVSIISDRKNENNYIIVSAATDGTIRIWNCIINESEMETDSYECTQIIETKASYALTLSLSYLPNSNNIILATGGTSLRIDIYTQNIIDKKFNMILSLQGHTDWIRSLSFAEIKDNPNTLMLASSSQDKYIRVWKISESVDINSTKSVSSEDIFESFNLNNINTDRFQLSTKAHMFEITKENNENQKYALLLDSVLMGHDNWVYSVKWKQTPEFNIEPKYEMELLSASADNTMIIWTPDPELNGVWNSNARVGELGIEYSGFIGGLFSPDGNAVLANSFTGAFFLWKKNKKDNDEIIWEPQVTITGHFGPVEQINWDPTSNYLISVSKDQTARLFMKYRKTNNWNEIARPQIHGYDMKCFSFIDNHRYICGADEKVLRVIQAPVTFLKTYNNFLGIDSMDIEDDESRPLSAALPALGLSNKAVLSSNNDENKNIEGINSPPIENYLINYTLWPEMQKLYGHGYEIMSIVTTHDYKMAASVNKAAKPEHATIRLWDVKTWKEYPNPLSGHNLTITSLGFSPNDQYLLSVSRDRSWSVYKKNEVTYQMLAHNPKAHARIIWDCSWSPDNSYFATASRDKLVKIWNVKENAPANQWLASTIKFDESVTAVQFYPEDGPFYVLAIGFEDGKIKILKCNKNDIKMDGSTWEEFGIINESDMHVDTVNSLRWRKTFDNKLCLASCSKDGSIRIFESLIN